MSNPQIISESSFIISNTFCPILVLVSVFLSLSHISLLVLASLSEFLSSKFVDIEEMLFKYVTFSFSTIWPIPWLDARRLLKFASKLR